MSCTGVAIFNLDKQKPVLISHVKTNDKETYGKRLHTIREFLKDLMGKYPPYEVAIERGYTFHNNATQVLYRCHGVCNQLFHEYDQFYYPPATIKKLITGNGRASKSLVQDKILEKYPNLEFMNEDESDAVGIAVSHMIKKYKMKW